MTLWAFRALVLLGVAVAFHAAITPHMTKSSVAVTSKSSATAEANHPVAVVPPQVAARALGRCSGVSTAVSTAESTESTAVAPTVPALAPIMVWAERLAGVTGPHRATPRWSSA